MSSSDPLREQLLNSNGIQVHETSLRMSQLVFTGAVQIRAIVRCIASAESDTLGNQVEVRIYGKMFN